MTSSRYFYYISSIWTFSFLIYVRNKLCIHVFFSIVITYDSVRASIFISINVVILRNASQCTRTWCISLFNKLYYFFLQILFYFFKKEFCLLACLFAQLNVPSFYVNDTTTQKLLINEKLYGLIQGLLSKKKIYVIIGINNIKTLFLKHHQYHCGRLRYRH